MKIRVIAIALLSVLLVINSLAQVPPEWQKRVSEGKMLYSTYEPSVESKLHTYVGNGYVATQINNDAIYIGGVYNGPAASENPSRRARIPSIMNVHVDQSEIKHCAIDLIYGTYFRRSSLRDANIEQIWYAHRVFKNLLVHEIHTSKDGTDICLQIRLGEPSTDFNFTTVHFGQDFQTWYGSTQESEHPKTPLVKVAVTFKNLDIPTPNGTHYYCTRISRNSPFKLYATFATSLETTNPIQLSQYLYNQYINVKDLYKPHALEWENIWRSTIEVKGNLQLQQMITSSLYYILGSIRDDWNYSLSPGSLSSVGYGGRVFWDCEIWMYPPILVLHPKLARGIIQYRLERLDGAREKAKSYQKGYRGTMFPWESAASGIETCPTWAPTGELQQHISGDVLWSVQQYIYTHNDSLSRSEKLKLYELVKGVAEFFESRVTLRTRPSDKIGVQYDIDGIIPPDEYAVNVNNSIFTNAIAQISLEYASKLGNELNQQVPPTWMYIAQRLYNTFDKYRNIHLEYEGYAGELIKQADVVLLGYPLIWKELTKEARLADLKYYEERTDHEGPAMTWGMHSIGWLEAKEFGRAAEMLKKCYANIQKPFNVWTETPTGGTTNFITGAGGFLQNIINGYGGLRIHPDSLSWDPELLPNSSQVAFKGIHYRSNVLNVVYDDKIVNVSIVSGNGLRLRDKNGNIHIIRRGSDVILQKQPFVIFQ